MKALRLHGHRDLRLEDVREPEVKPDWSIVEVEWASICASDIKEYLGPLIASAQPHPVTGIGMPVILGHEFAGTVVETDGTRPDIHPGDRVAVACTIRDGVCWYCQHGEFVLCDNYATIGFHANGGFAERVVVPNYGLHKLPEGVTTEEGAVIEPLAVSVNAVRRARLALGDAVAVVGAGMIGLATVAMARATGARAVYSVEPLPVRRRRAERLGAVTIDPTQFPAVSRLMELTSGFGADVAFDCVGTQASLELALNLARKGGRVVAVGVFKSPPVVDMNRVVLHQRELIGSLGTVDSFPRAIALVADGRVKAREFISDRIPLRDVIDLGFDRLISDPDQHVRIIVNTREG
jgi:(R,R)-butanediol dehydrogenase/meso-butanediol dehydrogenase/diacetyl reductase